jgi:hypothetical protein
VIIADGALVDEHPVASTPSSRWVEPMFEVMMITVFLKFTVRALGKG